MSIQFKNEMHAAIDLASPPALASRRHARQSSLKTDFEAMFLEGDLFSDRYYRRPYLRDAFPNDIKRLPTELQSGGSDPISSPE